MKRTCYLNLNVIDNNNNKKSKKAIQMILQFKYLSWTVGWIEALDFGVAPFDPNVRPILLEILKKKTEKERKLVCFFACQIST